MTIRLWDESLQKSTMVSDSIFSIKTCSRIGIIFRIFATSVCTKKSSSRFCVGLFKFSHNGKILYGDETPSELALCDGDVIDAVIDDLGGSQLV